MLGILFILWVISMVIEFGFAFSYFRKRHEGETVFYTGSYMEMKQSLLTKDFRDSITIVGVPNIILILVLRAIAPALLRILSFILGLLKWGLILGGVILLLYAIYTFFTSRENLKKIEQAWKPEYPQLFAMDMALVHVEEDNKAGVPDAAERKKQQDALNAALAKKEKGEQLDETEKKMLETYPDGKIPEPKSSLTAEEQKMLEDNPKALEEAKKYRKEKEAANLSTPMIVVAVVMLALSWLVSNWQKGVETTINPDAAQEVTEPAGTEPDNTDIGNATIEYTPQPTSTPTPTPKPTQKPTPEPTEPPAEEIYDESPTEVPPVETQWTDYGAETIYGTFYWVGDVLTPESIGETRAPWCVDAEPALNVRGGPGTEYDKIGSIPYGTWIGQVTDLDEESDWMYVEYTDEDDGTLHYGWVTKEHLVPGY